LARISQPRRESEQYFEIPQYAFTDEALGLNQCERFERRRDRPGNKPKNQSIDANGEAVTA
jgi:hypothetical protein